NRGAAAAKGDSGADRQGSTDADRQGIRAAPEDDGAATAQGLDAAERQSGIVGSSWAAYQGRAVEGKPVQNDEGGRESTGEVQVAIECHPVQSAGGRHRHIGAAAGVDDSTLESAAVQPQW